MASDGSGPGERSSLEERFSGSLIGQCLGDALGLPVEGYVAEVSRQYVSGVLHSGRAGSVGRPPFPFGQYSDDSQLARELLISYRDCRCFDPEDYARRIALIFEEKRVVGPGRATAEAAARLAEGMAWEKAGTPSPSAGNGSAMRSGPVGLLFHDDPVGLRRAAIDQGRITHSDERCRAGSAVIAAAVALAVAGRAEREDFTVQLAELAGNFDSAMATGILGLRDWLDAPPAEAAAAISVVGREPGRRDPSQGITPFVTGSVIWSLYAFLRSPGDYWETVCMAVAGGGDTDTTAAMAGAVSGAFVGLSGIPRLLAEKLNDRGGWRYDDLVGLAVECCRIKSGRDTS